MSDLDADAKGGIKLDFGEAGFVMLILNVNLSTLTAEDRRFALEVLESFIIRSGR